MYSFGILIFYHQYVGFAFSETFVKLGRYGQSILNGVFYTNATSLSPDVPCRVPRRNPAGWRIWWRRTRLGSEMWRSWQAWISTAGPHGATPRSSPSRPTCTPTRVKSDKLPRPQFFFHLGFKSDRFLDVNTNACSVPMWFGGTANDLRYVRLQCNSHRPTRYRSFIFFCMVTVWYMNVTRVFVRTLFTVPLPPLGFYFCGSVEIWRVCFFLSLAIWDGNAQIIATNEGRICYSTEQTATFNTTIYVVQPSSLSCSRL